AIFGEIGIVGMAGAEFVADRGIILGALVNILDDKRDRRSGGHLAIGAVVLEDAGKDLHLVRLAPLCGEARLAGPALVEIGLDVAFAQRQPRRTAIDDAANRRPMAFAKGCHSEHVAEAVVRHAPLLKAQCRWRQILRPLPDPPAGLPSLSNQSMHPSWR